MLGFNLLCPPAIIEYYRKKRKHMKEEIPMKTKYKLLSILICIILLTLCACGEQTPTPSNGNSQTDSSDKDGNTESEQIMTEEEIIAVFTDLDSKTKDLLKW